MSIGNTSNKCEEGYITVGNTIQSQRQEFFNKLSSRGGAKDSQALVAEYRAQAPHNAYAKQMLRNHQTDEMKLESSRADDAMAISDTYQSAADATNFIGDTFTMGAHRNLNKMADQVSAGNYKEATKELGKAGMRVTGGSLLAAPSKIVTAGNALKVAQGTSKLAQGTRAVGGAVVQHAHKGVNAAHAAEAAHTLDNVAKSHSGQVLSNAAKRNLQRNSI